MSVPITDQITEVKREIAMRKSAYPRWIAAGRLKQEDADVRIARMAAVLATLERLHENAPFSLEP